MQRIEKSIEVEVPVHTAYNQWTQFETFPLFMEGVEQVHQMDDKRLHWVAEVGGRRKEWNAEIVEQAPDEVISWRSTEGALNSGSVSFTPVDANHCRITLVLAYEPDGVIERLGAPVLSGRVEGDLRRFKEFVEKRQVETGAWRGEIHGGQVTRKDSEGGQGEGL